MKSKIVGNLDRVIIDIETEEPRMTREQGSDHDVPLTIGIALKQATRLSVPRGTCWACGTATGHPGESPDDTNVAVALFMDLRKALQNGDTEIAVDAGDIKILRKRAHIGWSTPNPEVFSQIDVELKAAETMSSKEYKKKGADEDAA